MSKRHRPNKNRTDWEGVVRSITLKRYEAADFFDDDALLDRMTVARVRILKAFAEECELVRGKLRRTDNYIGGVDTRQSDLARYIATHCKRFIWRHDLVELIPSDVPKKLVDQLIFQLQYEIILMQLNAMCSWPLYQVYFDETLGVWQIVQTAMDELYATRRRIEEVKRDDRSFHGRPRNQTQRRGIPPGTSIGLSRTA